MLDHDDGIAQIAQLLDHLDQMLGITRMQADAGFIQYVQGTHQSAAQGIGQINPLALPAGQAGRGPVQTQIGQTHIFQVLQTIAYLGQHPGSNRPFIGGQLDIFKECRKLVHLHPYQIRNALAVDFHVIGILAQTAAMAIGAKGLAPVARSHDPVLYLVGILLDEFEAVVDALGILAAMPEDILLFLAQLLVRSMNRKFLLFGITDELLLPLAHLLAPPTGHRILVNRQGRIGNHQILADPDDRAYAFACLASPVWIIETEKVGTGLDKTHPVHLQTVGELQETGLCARCRTFYITDAIPFVEGSLHRIENTRIQCPLLFFRPDHQTVHQQVIARQAFKIACLANLQHFRTRSVFLAYLVQTAEAPLLQKPQIFGNLQAFADMDRSQNIYLGAFRKLDHEIGHIAHRMPAYFPAGNRGINLADTGVKQFEVFVDFRHGSHRGTGIEVYRLLLDGDSRGNAFHEIHFRLAHPPQELAGVSAEAFHIAALAFGIEGVEHQG